MSSDSDDDVFWTYENKRKSKQQQSAFNIPKNQQYQQFNQPGNLNRANYQRNHNPRTSISSGNFYQNEQIRSPEFYAPPFREDLTQEQDLQLSNEIKNSGYFQGQRTSQTTKNIPSQIFMNLSATRSPKSVQNKQNTNGQTIRNLIGQDKENQQIKEWQNQGSNKYVRKGGSIWEDLYNDGQFLLEKKKIIQQIKMEKENSQFDFKPNLNVSNKKTPKSSQQSLEIDSSFYERNEAWKDQRENKLISKRQRQIYLDLKQCTFSPVVNKSSRSSSRFFQNEQGTQRINRALSSTSMASPKANYQVMHQQQQQNKTLVSQLQQKEIERLEKHNKELVKQLKTSQAKLLMQALKKEYFNQQMQFIPVNSNGWR